MSVCSTTSLAFSGSDTRSGAMGGTGVASANYLTAGFYNPALVDNNKHGDFFGFILPSFSVSAHDPDDLYNKIDDFQDVYDRIGNESVSEDEWKAALKSLDDGNISIDAKVGISVAIPNPIISANLFTKAQISMLAQTDISDEDLDINLDDRDPELTSTVEGLAGGTVELGVALARSFDIPFVPGQSISVGISPKLQRMMAIKYKESASGFDDNEFDIGSDYTDKSVFNLDLGFAYRPIESLTIGLSGRDLITHKLETNDQKTPGMGGRATYVVEPKYTLGAAYSYAIFTLAADVDLNKRKYFEESNYETQFAKIGAEIDAFDWAQVRAGYSISMTDYADNVITAGIGLKPFASFGIDLAGQYGQDSNYGASLQFVFTL
ncbi:MULTISPECIES: conjugal transfer protein TraF [unclassified Photobacterium]|uniref:conjugal transfer protein TraF n=1 Tax=unclassified Photobacterium TaxID=2628852 RepID=UPI001EDE5E11|nr:MULTISPECIES: conjugal transfer protein TraF [unclassified Photobacterium]